MTVGTRSSVRECARSLIATLDGCGDDVLGVRDELEPPIRRLLERPDLVNLGVFRPPTHSAYAAYLYYDGELQLLLAGLKQGQVVEVHDHGTWEAIAVYHDPASFSSCNTVAGPFTRFPVPFEGDDVSDIIGETPEDEEET